MNPCSKCGNDPQLEVDAESTAFLTCPCGQRDLYSLWNKANPISEPDPLSIAHEQLAECYDLLDGIVARHVAGNDIVILANDLLAKHRSENA